MDLNDEKNQERKEIKKGTESRQKIESQEISSKNSEDIKKNNKKIIFIFVLLVVIVATIIALIFKDKIIKVKDDNENEKIGYIAPLNQNEIIELEDKSSKIVSTELIVTFKDNVSNDEVKKVIEKYDGEIVGEIYFLNQYQVKFEESGEELLNKKKEDLKSENTIESVMYNYINESELDYNKAGGVISGEVHIDKDYHISELGIDTAYNLVDSNENINVGIIDSPIYYEHEDLDISKDNIYFPASPHFETIDDVLSYYSSYDHEADKENTNKYHVFGEECSYLGYRSHGTHVAGIIAGKHNGEGIDGVNDRVNLYYASGWYHLKHDEVEGRFYNTGTTFSISYALSSLIMSDCKIINMSIAKNEQENGKKIPIEDDSELYLEYREYYNNFFEKVKSLNKDFLIVKSAGNDKSNKEYDVLMKVFKQNEFANNHMIVVGGAKRPGTFELNGHIPNLFYEKATYSNYGEYVDVFALGTIYSTIYGNDYEWMEGTSQATPIVSGIASLVFQANPNLTAEQVKAILINSGTDYVTCDGRDVGVVNAENSVKTAVELYGGITKQENEVEIGLIQGTVKDANNELIQNNVYIYFKNTETNETIRTDIFDWNYECFLPFGTYNVEARIDGYVRYQKEGIKIDSTQPIIHDIKLNSNAEGGVKAGTFTLSYGTYKSDLPEGELNGGLYIINQDGTFEYENTWANIQGEITNTRRTGTYEVKYLEGDDYDPTSSWVIIFKTEESNEKYPQETDAYDIKGNNQFSARQYMNNWTYVGNVQNKNTTSTESSNKESSGNIDKQRSLSLMQNYFGDWKNVKVDYEYVTTIKDRYDNTYHVINAYAHENFMYYGGEWLEEIADGRFYAGTYYVRTSYTYNNIYIGYNPRDYGKYFTTDTIGYFMESHIIKDN